MALETAVADPGWDEPPRIGVELWDHPCDAACTDPPTGFAFVDPVVPIAS